jgi:molybdopterin synthase sulfur carrier subunit
VTPGLSVATGPGDGAGPAPDRGRAVVRVRLPAQLRDLARVTGEVEVGVVGPVTLGSVLDHLEEQFPVLKGTVRDRATAKRRAFIRFFAGEDDLSNAPPDIVLPEAVTRGREPFFVVGAMAGG